LDQIINQDLLLKAQKADKYAFKLLVEETNQYAYNLAFKMIANEEDARDIVQEAFIRVWKHINTYNPKIKFTTWLYKIIINLCLDHLKMLKRRNYYTKESMSGISLNTGHFLEKNIENENLISIMKSLIKEISPKQQVLFVLYFIEEKNIDEICLLTGFKKGNVKSNIYYARLKMQEMLQKEINYNSLKM